MTEAVRTFYVNGSFGHLDTGIRERIKLDPEKVNQSYAAFDTSHAALDPLIAIARSVDDQPWIIPGESGFSPLISLQGKSNRPRHLYGMPDLGNPNILGGLCWWKEYLPLVLEAGWKALTEDDSDSKMGFGDGLTSTKVCMAKRFLSQILLQDKYSISFLADAHIVPNMVGLLFGRRDMKASRMQCELVNNTFRFADRKCPAKVLETAHHYIFLDFPKKKKSEESSSEIPSTNTASLEVLKMLPARELSALLGIVNRTGFPI